MTIHNKEQCFAGEKPVKDYDSQHYQFLRVEKFKQLMQAGLLAERWMSLFEIV